MRPGGSAGHRKDRTSRQRHRAGRPVREYESHGYGGGRTRSAYLKTPSAFSRKIRMDAPTIEKITDTRPDAPMLSAVAR